MQVIPPILTAQMERFRIDEQPSPAHTDFTMASSRSKGSSRSQSPQKHIGSTRLSTIPVDLSTLSPQNEPEGFGDLIRDVRKIYHGQQVVPRGVESKFAEIGEALEEYQKHDKKYLKPGLTHQAFFTEALKLRNKAADCKHRRVSEARWNGTVHYRVLELAFEGYWKERGIWFEDVTSARISDQSLLASIKGKAVSSKLVDLAIIIDSDGNRDLENRIKTKILQQDTKAGQDSINCTSAEYVQFNPIAVAIETKRDVSSGDPYLQLGIWMTAHFLKLRQLVSPKVSLLSMPVLRVDGHRWYLLFATLKTWQTGDQLLLIGDVAIGSTESVAEIYATIAALQRIATWVHNDYRTWFEKNVLNSCP